MAKRCEFPKKNGERCGADVQTGKNVCVFHDSAKAVEGRRARRAGGISRSRRAAVLPSDTPDRPRGNAKDVSALLAESINQLRRGQLDPRVGNAMGYLTSVLLHSLEQGALEERVARLEAATAGYDANKQAVNTGENTTAHAKPNSTEALGSDREST
jgi:hypothetical protein